MKRHFRHAAFLMDFECIISRLLAHTETIRSTLKEGLGFGQGYFQAGHCCGVSRPPRFRLGDLYSAQRCVGGGRRFFPAACGPGGAHRQELHPYPGPAAPETPPSVPDHCRHFGRRAHGPCMAGGGAFVEAAEKPGKAFRWADNLLFSSFFLLTYGRPGVARLFCFSAGEFCGILG